MWEVDILKLVLLIRRFEVEIVELKSCSRLEVVDVLLECSSVDEMSWYDDLLQLMRRPSYIHTCPITK